MRLVLHTGIAARRVDISSRPACVKSLRPQETLFRRAIISYDERRGGLPHISDLLTFSVEDDIPSSGDRLVERGSGKAHGASVGFPHIFLVRNKN
jgi:hypothetical protein